MINKYEILIKLFDNSTPMSLVEITSCLKDVIKICQNAKYPEDLEDIYDVLDEYCPSWKGAK